MSPVAQRLLGALVLLVVAVLSLPVAAALLDEGSAESWIVPLQLLVMAATGAAAGGALPALAGVGAPMLRRLLIGAGWGVLAGLVGLLVFWSLLGGFGGA